LAITSLPAANELPGNARCYIEILPLFHDCWRRHVRSAAFTKPPLGFPSGGFLLSASSYPLVGIAM